MRWGKELTASPSKLCVDVSATVFEALRVIDEGTESIAFVCANDGRVLGSLTDGDLRRAILSGTALDAKCLSDIMRRDFAYVSAESTRADVLDIMRARDIGQLPIIGSDGRLEGLHTIGQIISARPRPNGALILAGGRGTRLRPYTNSLPKPMIPVAGRPILERLVLHLMSHGIRKMYLSVSYLANVIEDHFGDGSRFGCQIEYLREETPLGTGGPLALLDPLPSEPLIVVNGDLVTQCDFARLLDHHESGGYDATVSIRPFSVQIPFGVVELDGDRLTTILEKPTHKVQINAGIYVISPQLISWIPRNTEYPITCLLDACLEKGRAVGCHFLEQEWLDVGGPEEMRLARSGE